MGLGLCAFNVSDEQQIDLKGSFPWRAPGIQINVLVIYRNALPPSYRAWGALFTIAKARIIHA